MGCAGESSLTSCPLRSILTPSTAESVSSTMSVRCRFKARRPSSSREASIICSTIQLISSDLEMRRGSTERALGESSPRAPASSIVR